MTQEGFFTSSSAARPTPASGWRSHRSGPDLRCPRGRTWQTSPDPPRSYSSPATQNNTMEIVKKKKKSTKRISVDLKTHKTTKYVYVYFESMKCHKIQNTAFHKRTKHSISKNVQTKSDIAYITKSVHLTYTLTSKQIQQVPSSN